MNKKLLWLFGSLLVVVLALNVWLVVWSKTSPVINGDQVEDIINQEITGEVVAKPALVGVDNPLAGHSWKIVSLADGQEMIDAFDDDLTISFSDQQITGRICNQFSLPYKLVAGDNLVANGPLTNTEMACTADIMKIESVFFLVVQKGFGYNISDSGDLTLTGGDGQVIGLVKGD